jgi:hypothetical protein
MDFIKD